MGTRRTAFLVGMLFLIATASKLLSPFGSQRLTLFLSAEHHSHMERLASYMATGDVVPAVGRRYRLEEAAQAISDLEAGYTRGKSVIVVDEGHADAV